MYKQVISVIAKAKSIGALLAFLVFNRHKRTVVFVTHEMNYRGAPLVMVDAVLFFKNQGYAVCVVTMQDGPLRQEYEAAGIVPIFSKNLQKNFVALAILRMFDVVFLNTLVCYKIAKRVPRKKLIWWIHEGRDFFLLSARKHNKLRATMNKLQSRIVWVSQFCYDRICNDIGYDIKCQLLPFGVKDVCEDDDTKKSRSVKNECISFICVGYFCKNKNQIRLIEAVKKVLDNNQGKMKMIFVGDENERGYLDSCKALAQDYLTDIQFENSVSRNEILMKIKDADIVICPSIEETVSAVLIEGMMLNKICLSSKATGVAFALQNDAASVLFDPGDADEMASLIDEVIKDPEKYESTRRYNRQQYFKLYSPDKFEATLLKFLSDNQL